MVKYYASNKKHAFEKFLKTWENIHGILLTEKIGLLGFFFLQFKS